MILYSRGVGPTARRLARLLNISTTRKIVPGIKIRWGCSRAGNDSAINTQDSIRLAAHGYNSLVTMKLAGIPTLEVTRSPKLFPVYGRKYKHRAGNDIIICNNNDEVIASDSNFFTQYVETHREFRVHVFDGKVIKMFRKQPIGDTANELIRTSQFGWHYTNVDLSNYKRGQNLAIEAVKSLGLVFGGADLGLNMSNKEYVLFEVNTAPSLNSITLALYVENFKRYFNDNS